jgi:hypothetical protein
METHLTPALKKSILAVLLVFSFVAGRAQFVTTVPPLAGTNNQSGITFNVGATSNLTITEIWTSFLTGTYTVSVWYNPDSINSAPTINAANGWVQLCNNVNLNVIGGGLGIIQQIPFAFAIPMAPGDVFGFYIEATNMPNLACIYYTNYVAPAQYVWGNTDMYINTGNGNVGWGGPSPNPTFSPRMFNGKVVYQLGPPPPPDCTQKPVNIVQANKTKTSIDMSWDPVPAAVSYEYVLDQNVADPTSVGYNYTTTPSVSFSNLIKGGCYYLHVRSVCQVPDVYSDWSLDSFCTIPECEIPIVTIENIRSTDAIARWDAVPGAYAYEYSVGTTPAPPINGTTTTYTSVKLLGLMPNAPLYFFIRAKCNPTPLSEWGIVPFHTMAGLWVDDVDSDGFALEAYPNPVNHKLSLHIAGNHAANASINITDVLGRVVYRQVVTGANMIVDMSAIQAGLYMVRYADDIHKNTIKITKE